VLDGYLSKETATADSLSTTNVNAMAWGVGWVDIRYSRCADLAVPVKCTVSEMAKFVKPATTCSVSRIAS